MQSDSKIYLAGHRGLVGSALKRCLSEKGFTNIITCTHGELDLTDFARVGDFFDKEKPEYIFLAAAKVGGILANRNYPADFIQQNIAIQYNVIWHSWRVGVKRLLFLGSSCIYPRECPQPIKEEYLLTGSLEPTNRPYAVAKIAGIEMCWAYNRQYGTRYLAVMPTNLYGPGDNYNLQNSHVLPALIRKMHEAKVSGDAKVEAWGTGSPRREFLFSEDLADACIFLMSMSGNRFDKLLTPSIPPLINIGCGQDLTIRELVFLVKDIVGYSGEVQWDVSKPDGTPRKLLEVSRLSNLGWLPKIDLSEGIRLAYKDFLAHEKFYSGNLPASNICLIS
ncbi:MAG: GDP-L-fucose synthase [Proteobacteria bacterium]|nr:GDP-L-fucose synthase [Pseudomonadota bacterium]MBU0964829.1 GDP-L-fucose synthase [Pseudomonadota bacterium]